jgi:hypothetical protein
MLLSLAKNCSIGLRSGLYDGSSNKGCRLPVAVRNPIDKALASQSPAVEPGHFRVGASLVDKNQPPRIKFRLCFLQLLTGRDHVRPILLRGSQAFFYMSALGAAKIEKWPFDLP